MASLAQAAVLGTMSAETSKKPSSLMLSGSARMARRIPSSNVAVSATQRANSV
jgi:hypothetical protein